MAISQTFDAAYPDHPWASIATNQREWYDPILRDIYMNNAIYNRFVTTQFLMSGDVSTTTMHITSLIPPHANFDPIGLRDIWSEAAYFDSLQRSITFQHFGGKVSYHKYDNAVTYWKQNGRAGLNNIIRRGLGGHMIGVMDMLARNAFLENTFSLYGSGSGTDFTALSGAETMTTEIIDQVHLAMEYRNLPFTQNGGGDIICVTSPGIMYDLRREWSASDDRSFVSTMQYANPTALVNGEVGSYHNTRFVVAPQATLFNCGPIAAQGSIKAAITSGDGSPATAVDGVKTVGQSAATHFIQLDTGEAADFAVNDYVTIHTDRTNANGVTNGVDYRDGTLQNRRIVSLPGSDRIALDLPIMTDFDTDLGGGVYGYVTKGQHVHTAIFLGAADGVVMGINQPPRIYDNLQQVDDFNAMYRFSWDGYFDDVLFNPEAFETVFLNGSFRMKGAIA